MERALAAFRRAVVLDPGFDRAYVNASVALHRLNRLDMALRIADRAVRLAPANRTARNARSAMHLDLNQPDRALADAEAVLAGGPADAEATLNRGVALQRLGRLAEAGATFDEAVRRWPQNPATRHARSYLRLLHGDLPLGWVEREARWDLPGHVSVSTVPGVPLWDGAPLDGRCLLVVGDEGRGDMIQYVRLLRRPPFDRARVILWVPAYMVRLFARALPGVEVRDSVPPGAIDYQTPLSRLPAVLGIDLAGIPAEVPYLSVEPERAARWRARIGDRGFRIAVCWQGNPGTAVDRGRSIPLGAFAPLAAIPGVRLIALQTRHGVEQLSALPQGMAVETLGPDFDTGPDSFLDPGAVALAADLVVSSDTALAHLAGALACPVWLALRRIPDFRWLLDRENSPWYPTMRLFRQRTEGDWDDVLGRIAAAVRRRMADGR